jgi:GNAT superfamily N-acetyltransferase
MDADTYTLVERTPTVDEFQALRAAADMAERPRAGVERGLPNSLYAVVVAHDPSGDTVAMGRVLGDDGSVFHLSDMAVHPDHQRHGLGSAVLEALLEYVEDAAAPGAYVNLMADVDGFYERYGFAETRPASKGMFLRTD